MVSNEQLHARTNIARMSGVTKPIKKLKSFLKKRHRLIAFAAVFAACAILYQNHRSIAKLMLKLSVQPLKTEAGPDLERLAIDRIVVLIGGNSTDRADRAADVFARQRELGHDPRIVIARPEDTDLVAMGYIPNTATVLSDYLIKSRSIPADHLDLLGDSRNDSTKDELQTVLQHLKAQEPRPRNVLFVTRWWHTARSQWIARRVFAGSDINVLVTGSGLDAGFRIPAWWRNENDVIGCWTEYLKWAGNLIRG